MAAGSKGKRRRKWGAALVPRTSGAETAGGRQAPEHRAVSPSEGSARRSREEPLSCAPRPAAPHHGLLTSLLHVRVREVREREAGDAGGGDGEPGAGCRVRPAGLRAAGRRRGEVLGVLKGRLGAEDVTRRP